MFQFYIQFNRESVYDLNCIESNGGKSSVFSFTLNVFSDLLFKHQNREMYFKSLDILSSLIALDLFFSLKLVKSPRTSTIGFCKWILILLGGVGWFSKWWICCINCIGFLAGL